MELQMYGTLLFAVLFLYYIHTTPFGFQAPKHSSWGHFLLGLSEHLSANSNIACNFWLYKLQLLLFIIMHIPWVSHFCDDINPDLHDLDPVTLGEPFMGIVFDKHVMFTFECLL